MSDVNNEGCKLQWKRPEDDGGTPIEYYLVEKFDTQKGSWIPCGRSPETGWFDWGNDNAIRAKVGSVIDVTVVSQRST